MEHHSVIQCVIASTFAADVTLDDKIAEWTNQIEVDVPWVRCTREYAGYGTFQVQLSGSSQSCLQRNRVFSDDDKDNEDGKKEEYSCTHVNVVLVRLFDLAAVHPEQLQAKLNKKRPVSSMHEQKSKAVLSRDALGGAAEKLVAQTREYLDGMRGSGTWTLLVLCASPPHGEEDVEKRANLYRELHTSIKRQLEDAKRGDLLAVLSPEELFAPCSQLESSTPPTDSWWYDGKLDRLAHNPFTSIFYRVLAQHIVTFALVRCSNVPRKKVICIDCDNTLWGGACAELGADVGLTEEFLERQRWFVELQQRGFVLCLVSRNEEDDVERVFRERKADMPLDLATHVTATRINWQKKSQNILELADVLGLGLDSFIFVDDSPVECADVQRHASAVSVLHLPLISSFSFLRHHWAFHALRSYDSASSLVVLTAEDRRRTALYRQKLAREKAAKKFQMQPAFLASLQLMIDIARLTTESEESVFARAAQLTERTNQMNCAKDPISVKELRAGIEDGRWVGFVVSVGDRFGHHGLVGVIVADNPEQSVSVRVECRTFLLSCRSLQLGVEHAMLRTLGELAKEHGKKEVAIRWCPAERNAPSYLFLQSVEGMKFLSDPTQLLGSWRDAQPEAIREAKLSQEVDDKEPEEQPRNEENENRNRDLHIPREERHLWYDGRRIDKDLLELSRASQKKEMRRRYKTTKPSPDTQKAQKMNDGSTVAEAKKQSIPLHVLPEGVSLPDTELVVSISADVALSAAVTLNDDVSEVTEVVANASDTIQKLMADPSEEQPVEEGLEEYAEYQDQWRRRRKMRHAVKELLQNGSAQYKHVSL